MWSQRRFQVSERWEYRIGELAGLTWDKKTDQPDPFWGLHASQYIGRHDLFGFSVEGAWNSFTNNMPAASMMPGGGAVGFNLVYEWQYSGILVQTGVGINYQQVYNDIRDTCFYTAGMHDKWESIDPGEYVLKHDFYNRRDMARNLYAQVPIYAGHYIIGPDGVGYFLAGLQFNYALLGSTRQTLTGTTLASYEPFLGIWHEMDNHGYRKDVPIVRTGGAMQPKLKIDVRAHCEIGYEYTTFRGPHNYRKTSTSGQDWRFRFAGIFDYSVANISPKSDNPFYEVPMESIYDFPTYRMDHVFSTTDAKRSWVRNLYIGMRITVLIGIPRKEQCILCDAWRL